MSNRQMQRQRGRGGMPIMPDPKDVDPKIQAVADWLRNEKKSGLHTKEAVQYEKVRACAARAAHALPRCLCRRRACAADEPARLPLAAVSLLLFSAKCRLVISVRGEIAPYGSLRTRRVAPHVPGETATNLCP